MLADCTTLDDYIIRHQQDGVLWKAEKLLANLDNVILRQDRFQEMAHTISLIPKEVVREDYCKKIGKLYGLSPQTFRKMIDEQLVVNARKEKVKNAAVKKNVVNKLQGDPTKWPFFNEKFKTSASGEQTFIGINIDKFKFVQLLSSFGYSRYEAGFEKNGKDEFQFVKLEENVIRSVTRQKIIDYVVSFILKDYNFEAFQFQEANAEVLINAFFNQMRSLFSQDLFARVKTEDDIIINNDTKDATFFYYKNGFVKVDKSGWKLHPYEEMQGSVWETQMIPRKFVAMDPEKESGLDQYGHYADFCWKISGENEDRFAKLCGILGYLMHDYYEYKLKAISFTDSSLSEYSEGRTGKTLLAKMLGHVKGFTEINGKDFDATAREKYQDVDLGTQIVHLNDLKTRGRNKFDFEDVFNDITEGFMVKKLYLAPFRHRSKFIFSSNKTLNIVGASQRDRIVEFEMSQFFGEHLSPEQHYKHWFGRDWDELEWKRFDNFICFCANMFHINGLEAPAPINLGERKLMDHTAREFLDFMDDCRKLIEETGKPFDSYTLKGEMFAGSDKDFFKFEFDKKQLHTRFVVDYSDFKSWLTQNKFNQWLTAYANLHLKIKHPREWRSNSVAYIQFIETKKDEKK